MKAVRDLVTLVLALGALAPGAWTAPQEGEGEKPAEAAEGEGQDEGEEGAEEEKEAKYFAIVGGDVYSGTGAVLRGATVLGKNGKIEEIGYDLFVPEDAERLDATGLRVYPGLIALGASSRITTGFMAADDPRKEWEDADAGEPAIRFDGLLPEMLAHVAGEDDAHGAEPDEDDAFPGQEGDGDGEEQRSDIEDTFDPFNSFLVLALATGITTAEQSNAAIKLKRYEIDGVLLADRQLTTLTWNVSNPAGIRSLREKFERASKYVRELRAWKDRNDKGEKEPSKKGVDANALRVLQGESLALFSASRREDLLGIARFAQEFAFRPVIRGCEEGWTVADELGRAGATAILTPRSRLPKQEQFVRPGGSTIENAAILHKSGVQIAIRPESSSIDFVGVTGRDLLHLPVEAGFAVRGGLPNEAALAAMTIVPARVLGVDHRVGSLEVGKDLDAIVTDGDILHYQTFVQYAVVDGKLVYDKEKEIYFAHIRPRPPKPAPAAEAAPAETPEEGAAKSGEESGGAEEDADEKDDDEKDEDEAEDEGGGEKDGRSL